jgi:hypothetical protein
MTSVSAGRLGHARDFLAAMQGRQYFIRKEAIKLRIE